MYRLLLICFIFLPLQNAFACKCNWMGPLVEMAKDADIVVKAKVIRHEDRNRPLWMEIKIDEALIGEVTGNVRVYGDTGILCRPYIAQFPVDTQWIFVLKKTQDPREGNGNFYLSACGAYSAQMKTNLVVGQIHGEVKQFETQAVEFAEFKKLLKEHP